MMARFVAAITLVLLAWGLSPGAAAYAPHGREFHAAPPTVRADDLPAAWNQRLDASVRIEDFWWISSIARPQTERPATSAVGTTDRLSAALAHFGLPAVFVEWAVSTAAAVGRALDAVSALAD